MPQAQPAAEGLQAPVPFMHVPKEGAPYLSGVKCTTCGTVFANDSRRACGKCGARTGLESVRLAETGKLYNYTIVHRSYPGVKVPFISVIVDLDGGGTIKGNLLNVNPVPDAIKFDMPVKVVYDATDRKDAKGRSYLSYFFVPA